MAHMRVQNLKDDMFVVDRHWYPIAAKIVFADETDDFFCYLCFTFVFITLSGLFLAAL